MKISNLKTGVTQSIQALISHCFKETVSEIRIIDRNPKTLVDGEYRFPFDVDVRLYGADRDSLYLFSQQLFKLRGADIELQNINFDFELTGDKECLYDSVYFRIIYKTKCLVQIVIT